MSESIDSREQVREGNRNAKKRLIPLILLLGFIAGAAYWWLFMRNRVFTDNAYVMADSAAISSRIPGTISRVHVGNDDFVQAGDILLELDPRDYQASANKIRASLSRIESEIQTAEVTVRLTEAQTNAQVQIAQAMVLTAQKKHLEARHRSEEAEQGRTGARAEFSHTQKDFERYTNLYSQGAGSEQQRDRAATALKKARAYSDAMGAQVAEANAAIGTSLQEIERARAQLDSVEADRLKVDVEKNKLTSLKARHAETVAELQLAELNLSYCSLKAPISGHIAHKKIQVGERIQPAQALLAIVPLQEVYVEANLKETQLEDVRVGHPVEIKSDTYPGHTYHGKVAGIRAAAGSAFSLLPAENATGNWIKVVQRVPVRIRLDSPPPPERPLRIGTSLEVTVYTGEKSGPPLALPKPVKDRSE